MTTTGEIRADLGFDYELVRLVRRTRAYTNAHLDTVHPELDYNTFVIMLAIHDAPEGVRASDLVGELYVHKSTISRAVATLEKLGLLERVTHPQDGRAQLLTVPEDAKRRIEQFLEGSYNWLGGLLDDWEPEELRTFAQQLTRLNDAAERASLKD
jgi:DNA-binding MarR family transcriptional regulator